ncbi:MAG TPA: hypothetical protein VFU02_07360, partial [Polyangiaceae bacterium]|nr:hypothetical protein [Polyangiaceae bacterium]
EVAWCIMSLARCVICTLFALCSSAVGCAGAAPAAAPESPAPPEPESTPPSPSASAPVMAEPAPAVDAPPSPPEPEPVAAPEPSTHAREVGEACAKLCAQAAEQCSTRSARKCRANCERYEGLAERCGEATLAAVQCQAATPGLVCSNVVGPCAAEFQKLNACESGQGSSVAPEPSAAPATLPAHWVRLTDETSGFSVGLPKLGDVQTENGNRNWRVQDEQGITYVVAVLPPFQGTVSDKVLVQKVLVILGQRCQRDMKIHGRFQSEGREAVRFDSHCGNGESWHGMLRISERNVIMTAEIVPPGRTATGDPYYYSFTYL